MIHYKLPFDVYEVFDFNMYPYSNVIKTASVALDFVIDKRIDMFFDFE